MTGYRSYRMKHRRPLEPSGLFDFISWCESVLLVLWGIFAGFPVYWMAMTAFKNQQDIYQGPYFFPFVDFTPTARAWEFMMGPARDDVLRGPQK